MRNEQVFTVDGSVAEPATPVILCRIAIPGQICRPRRRAQVPATTGSATFDAMSPCQAAAADPERFLGTTTVLTASRDALVSTTLER